MGGNRDLKKMKQWSRKVSVHPGVKTRKNPTGTGTLWKSSFSVCVWERVLGSHAHGLSSCGSSKKHLIPLLSRMRGCRHISSSCCVFGFWQCLRKKLRKGSRERFFMGLMMELGCRWSRDSSRAGPALAPPLGRSVGLPQWQLLQALRHSGRWGTAGRGGPSAGQQCSWSRSLYLVLADDLSNGFFLLLTLTVHLTLPQLR